MNLRLPFMLRILPFAIALVGLSSIASAQSVISAHSGVVHWAEGQVTIEGTPVNLKFAEFKDVKNGETLAAQDGRAEVLLTPGVILRIAEDSSFKMISNTRSDTHLEVVTGTSLIEVGELLQGNSITLHFKDTQIALIKHGLYRVDADPGRLRVFEGEARVTSGSDTTIAKKGREVSLDGVLSAKNFDTKSTDAFLRWASRRSEYLATANVSAARAAGGNSYLGGVGGSGLNGYGSWAWNPWYGMFTYLPGSGVFYNAFGFPYYSPGAVGYYYYPTYGYYGGGGGGTYNSGTIRTAAPSGVNTSPRVGSFPSSNGLGTQRAGNPTGFGASTASPNFPSSNGGTTNSGGGFGSGSVSAPSSSGSGSGGMAAHGGFSGGGAASSAGGGSRGGARQ